MFSTAFVTWIMSRSYYRVSGWARYSTGVWSLLTLLLDAICLPVAGPGCRDISTSLQLLDQRQHSLVAEVEGSTSGCIGVKPSPLTRAGNYFHVASQSVDVTSETIVFLRATDLKQELQAGIEGKGQRTNR